MSDPVTAARQSEEQGRMPFIYIQEFETRYDPQPDGSQKASDWVTWGKKGVSNPATTSEKISRLQKSPDNPIWQVIEPAYKRWKDNQTADVLGTPLVAWPGASKELVKALAPVNIRSVEDLALMEDSAIMKLAIPNLRKLQGSARAFLKAQESTAGVAAENAKLKETVDHQAQELAELKELVAALAADRETDEPKRRGRPPKVAA